MTPAEPPAVSVLVVDDARSSRELLLAALAGDRSIQVVGCAQSEAEAVLLANQLHPALMIVNGELTRGNALEVTRQVMAAAPCPLLFLTSVPSLALAALAAGAVECLASQLDPASLRQAVATFSKVRVVRRSPPARKVNDVEKVSSRVALVAIGASSGGPAALKEILSRLPRQLPPVVIVQHVSKGFAPALASWLTTVSTFPVSVPEPGELLQQGRAYLAMDSAHLTVDRLLRAGKDESGPINGVEPSVDVLFHAVAAAFGERAIGVLLTGMGSDGARGLLAMRQAGARTIAQDAASSMIDGMPQAARALGAVEWVVPLPDIAEAVGSLVEGGVGMKGWST